MSSSSSSIGSLAPGDGVDGAAVMGDLVVLVLEFHFLKKLGALVDGSRDA